MNVALMRADDATIAGMDQEDAMPPTGFADTRWTYADLERLPADGLRHEIIDGMHYVTPSPNLRHQRLVGRLFAGFTLHLLEHPDAGEAFLSPLDVVFSEFDVVEPDLLFVTPDQQDILTPKHVRGAPAIVIEILSPGTRRVDETIKFRLFERSSVREYWLVDPELDQIKVYRRADDGTFPRVAELSAEAGDLLTTPLLRQFSVALPDLFR
jgi:Uma2 family endonuclease